MDDVDEWVARGDRRHRSARGVQNHVPPGLQRVGDLRRRAIAEPVRAPMGEEPPRLHPAVELRLGDAFVILAAGVRGPGDGPSGEQEARVVAQRRPSAVEQRVFAHAAGPHHQDQLAAHSALSDAPFSTSTSISISGRLVRKNRLLSARDHRVSRRWRSGGDGLRAPAKTKYANRRAAWAILGGDRMFPIRDHNPSRGTPYVTWALIAINIVVFLTYFTRPEPEVIAVFADWALHPARVAEGQDLHTLISAMFLHGGLMHILGNMLFLWIFGDNLEDHFGHLGFLVFYLATGFAASAAQIVADPTSTIPNVGASGAIAGVMGGYLLLFPKARVDVMVLLGVIARMVTMPAWTMLGLWFAIQVISGFVSEISQGGVAYWAHAGGFAAGVALVGVAWLAGRSPRRVDLHPDHPPTSASPFPAVRRRR